MPGTPDVSDAVPSLPPAPEEETPALEPGPAPGPALAPDSGKTRSLRTPPDPRRPAPPPPPSTTTTEPGAGAATPGIPIPANASTEAASERRSETHSETPPGSLPGALSGSPSGTLSGSPSGTSPAAVPRGPAAGGPAAGGATARGAAARRSGSGAGVSLARAQAETERRPAPAPGPALTPRGGSAATPAPTPVLTHTQGPAAGHVTATGPHPLATPPGELPGPAVPALIPRRGRRGRRGRQRAALLAAVGAVTVGAVVAIVLTAASGPPGDDTTAGSSPSAAASPSPSSTPSDSPAPTVEGTSRPQSLPPGAHREAGGFAWATPPGWRRDVKTGAEVHYTSPDGTQELAAKSALARGDLMESWQTSEQNARQGQDYRKIRLEETTFRGHPAVVWEYTFTLRGVPWHAHLLGFNANGKSYQINTWYQPDIETQALETYAEVRDSFTVV